EELCLHGPATLESGIGMAALLEIQTAKIRAPLELLEDLRHEAAPIHHHDRHKHLVLTIMQTAQRSPQQWHANWRSGSRYDDGNERSHELPRTVTSAAASHSSTRANPTGSRRSQASLIPWDTTTSRRFSWATRSTNWARSVSDDNWDMSCPRSGS